MTDSTNDLTSNTLIQRARSMDEDAWITLTEVYGPLIYYWCRRSGLSPDDAADILQDVFRSVASHLCSFRKEREGDSFRGWLWTITRNKIRDWTKVRKGKAIAAGGTAAHRCLADLPEHEPHELSCTQQTGIAHVVKRITESIRPSFEATTWQAFWRVTVDGIPSALVADELSISIDSVYQAKSRVLRKLRRELGNVTNLIIE